MTSEAPQKYAQLADIRVAQPQDCCVTGEGCPPLRTDRNESARATRASACTIVCDSMVQGGFDSPLSTIAILLEFKLNIMKVINNNEHYKTSVSIEWSVEDIRSRGWICTDSEGMEVLKGNSDGNTNNWGWVMVTIKPTLFTSK